MRLLWAGADVLVDVEEVSWVVCPLDVHQAIVVLAVVVLDPVVNAKAARG